MTSTNLPPEPAPRRESFFERNRTLLVGAFVVFMGVAMLLPASLQQIIGQGDPTLGTIGDRTLRKSDTTASINRWKLLRSLEIEANLDGVPRRFPFLALILGEEAVDGVLRDPAAMHLLLEEARNDGPGASEREVSELLSGPIPLGPGVAGTVVFRNEAGHTAVDSLGDDLRAQVRAAVADLLGVQARMRSSFDFVRASPPTVDRQLALQLQTVTARLIEIPSLTYLAEVPEPSDADLAEQLKKFADVEPGRVSNENPFGFGYRLPDRVKLHMITVARGPVKELVRASKDVRPDREDPTLPYGWVVEARKFYDQNPDSPVIQVEQDPAATQPTTGPTTRPFADVRKRLVEALIEQATEAKLTEIERRIRSTIEVDYQGYNTAKTLGTTPPATSVGPAFESIDYLRAVAADAERQFGVPVVAEALDEKFYGFADLAEHPTLGLASAIFSGPDGQPQELPLSRYVTEFAEPFIAEETRRQFGAIALGLWELSSPVQSFPNRIAVTMQPSLDVTAGAAMHLLRISDARANEPATEVASVRERLVADWKRVRALDRARETARAALARARETGSLLTATAFPSSGVVELGGSRPLPPQLSVPPVATGQFLLNAMAAMLDPSGDTFSTFDAPLADRVYLAERLAVRSEWESADELASARIEMASFVRSSLLGIPPTERFRNTGMTGRLLERLARDYLEVKSIYARNGFKPADAADGEGSSTTQRAN